MCLQCKRKERFFLNPFPDVFLLLLLLSFISSLQNCKKSHSLHMNAMNFGSPRANKAGYWDASLQLGQSTLLLSHRHSFWVTLLISHHGWQQLHAWTTSSSSVPDIWARNFLTAEEKKNTYYCNLGTVSGPSFHVLINLYLTVTAVTSHVQKCPSYSESQSIVQAPS